MFSLYNNVLNEFVRIFAVVSLILALLQVYFGYKLLRFWISLTGFAFGAALGWAIAYGISGGNRTASVIVAVIAGAVLAFIAYKLYLAGVFFYCGILAASALMSLDFPSGSGWGILKMVLAIVVFIVVGLLAVKYSRPFIIVTTAFTGTVNAITAMRVVWPGFSAGAGILTAMTLVFLISGIAVQFLTTHGGARKRR